FGGRVRITSWDEKFFSPLTLKRKKNEQTTGTIIDINSGSNASQISIYHLPIGYVGSFLFFKAIIAQREKKSNNTNGKKSQRNVLFKSMAR
ncbi:MAG: hypothetical protein SOT34_07690, partial [Candidatus Borkfalkiaceae bacterium]|nr:hypothetical protein [Christensenellaceae bacterium]